MLYVILAVVFVMNLAAFALMGIDKAKAKAGAWRIPEKTLFLVTALFGGLGGTLGMSFFRHKTNTLPFAAGDHICSKIITVRSNMQIFTSFVQNDGFDIIMYQNTSRKRIPSHLITNI